MSEREVVITGMGLLSPLGKDTAENWSGVKSMKTGISHFPSEGVPDYLQYKGRAAEFTLPDNITPRQQGQMKFLNRGALLGFCAACESVQNAGDRIAETEPGRRAIYVASGDHTRIAFEFMHPAIKDSTDASWSSIDYPKLNEAALNKVNPFFLLEGLNNNLFSFLSAYVEFMGPGTSLASLSPGGGNALELACRSIRHDRADIALAVGYGSWINDVALYELEGLGILSKCREGSSSYRPFDRKRDGFIAGEGGAAILLEDAGAAKARGRKVYGRIKGFSNVVEYPSPGRFGVADRVTARAIASALHDASLSPDELAFLISHGSGTRKGDASEMNSLNACLKTSVKNTPVCGLKPYTGHMGAASDLAEIILGINALHERVAPATLNFRMHEKGHEGLSISGKHQDCSGNAFLSISYGAGGQSSAVVIGSD